MENKCPLLEGVMNDDPIPSFDYFGFIIFGEPVAKGRPKFSSRGGFVKAYTPQKTLSYENLVKTSFDTQVGLVGIMQGEVIAEIDAYFSIPKSTSKKKEKLMLEGKIHPTKKPDLDNLAKTVLDALNGRAFKDDSQVVELHVRKYYSHDPRVEVLLKQRSEQQ